MCKGERNRMKRETRGGGHPGGSQKTSSENQENRGIRRENWTRGRSRNMVGFNARIRRRVMREKGQKRKKSRKAV